MSNIIDGTPSKLELTFKEGIYKINVEKKDTAVDLIERTITEANYPTVTTVGDYTFGSCSALTSIDLPVCTSVGDRAFYSCTKLTTVILRSTTQATLASTNAFNNCSALTGIYVPDSLVSQYKAATNWSTYAAKIKPLSELPS